MKIKTSELTGAALRWVVGMAEGYELSLYGVDPSIRARVPGLGVHAPWAPDTYWHQGGPIIERGEIGTRRNAPCLSGREWEASPSVTAKGAGGRYGYGPTPLIAAMRCFVASKLGYEVDVPEELFK